MFEKMIVWPCATNLTQQLNSTLCDVLWLLYWPLVHIKQWYFRLNLCLSWQHTKIPSLSLEKSAYLEKFQCLSNTLNKQTCWSLSV